MLIRRETPADVAAVRAVTAVAFARAETVEPIEVALLDQLRSGPAWLPPLSMVATGTDGAVVGHVVCSRAHVDGAPVVGLGPISVLPGHQRQGVGLALVHAVLGGADALGEPLVALLGSPDYYGRYGFRPSTEYGITAPDPTWGRFFQARPLAAYQPSLRGAFVYPQAFDLA
ncbi:putative acetyltransferase [Kitasatospora gansuensis]|uniref:Putative acetyltransferase n=1 Tax=Kitasatospora gansuensis TaxID=258050 RepID=A0A7W7S767_9ACTN|nr:N-acetyltransferase [Kitasatospora gansuensis]MBB4944782.1 putative acetyltransferase [Kitasatospora gansuensis]